MRFFYGRINYSEILVALETRQISKFDSDSEALNSVRFDSAQFPLIQLICVKFKL